MQLQLIAQLHFAITQRQRFRLPRLQQEAHFQALLGLASLARNCTLQKCSQLSILQSLTVLVSYLVGFKKPQSYLAAFDRSAFRKHCARKNSWNLLQHMAVGIYPYRKVTQQARSSLALRVDVDSTDDEFIGNPNWQLTRKIIHQYYNEATEEEGECLEVLLAMPQLKSNQNGEKKWHRLWAVLYFMVNSILTNEETQLALQQKLQWQRQLEEVIIREERHFFLQQRQNQEKERKFTKVILQLVSFIAKRFVFGVQSDLKEVVRLLRCLGQQDFPSQQYFLFSNLLLKDLFWVSGQHEAAAGCEDILAAFKQAHIHEQSTVVLRSYLMAEQELQNYLVEHGLNFWEYALDKRTNEILAQRCLRDGSRLGERFNWAKLFQYLSANSLKQSILAREQTWIKQPWAKAFVQTCHGKSQLLTHKIYQGDEASQLDQIKRNLRQFCSQWGNYQKERSQGMVRSLQQVESLLTFKTNIHADLQNSLRFPQMNSQYFAGLSTRYLEYVIDRDLVDSKYSLLLSPGLAQNLLSVQGHLLQEFWALWAQILISRDSTLQALLRIQNNRQEVLVAEEPLAGEEEWPANDRLYLRKD